MTALEFLTKYINILNEIGAENLADVMVWAADEDNDCVEPKFEVDDTDITIYG